MSKTKAGGSTKLGRDSESKRLGVKAYGGQSVSAGSIIVRQRGSKYIAGNNASYGNDYSIFALKDGLVKFEKRKKTDFTGKSRERTLVHIDTK